RHQKSVLAPHQIADAAKEQRAERTHQKAHRKGGQVGDVSERVIPGGIKLRPQDRRQTAEYVEVIPLDHGAHRRGHDHPPDAVLGPASSRDLRAIRHAFLRRFAVWGSTVMRPKLAAILLLSSCDASTQSWSLRIKTMWR